MSEMAKTLTFMAAGALALIAAFFVVPTDKTVDTTELIGQHLNDFDAGDAKRMKIVKFDSDTASTREFEVAEENGLWRIPSKEGYPADATKQMAEAATSLIDREILRIAATSPTEHEKLGVVDPTGKLDSKAQGVGTRVTLHDIDNSVLTDMIIGKKVKDADGQRYVRDADKDVVYVVNMDPKALTTKFEDWIEGDLLTINPFDVKQVDIKDYSAELVFNPLTANIQARWEPRGEMAVTYDEVDAKWSAKSLKKFDKASKKYVDFPIPDGEELNEEVLNALRDGLDDLKIVDVERKPAGLSADLKAGSDFAKDAEAAEDLMNRGFAPMTNEETKQEDILSSEGEVICSLKDGVEYVLRFGNLQVDSQGTDKPSEEVEGQPETADKKSNDSVNRYMFVMARFNENMIEKPELEELPALPADAPAEETPAEASEETPAESAETTDEAAPAEATADAEKPEAETKENSESTTGEAESPEAVADAVEGEEAKPDDAEEQAKQKELEDIIAARKEIEQENQRRMDEYNAKIKAGKEKVAELNERFGDWYYVISNDVYQQVHLGLEKILHKKGEKPAGEAAATGIPGMPNMPFANPPAQ